MDDDLTIFDLYKAGVALVFVVTLMVIYQLPDEICGTSHTPVCTSR